MVHERYKIYGGIARAVFAKDKFLILRFNELEGVLSWMMFAQPSTLLNMLDKLVCGHLLFTEYTHLRSNFARSVQFGALRLVVF